MILNVTLYFTQCACFHPLFIRNEFFPPLTADTSLHGVGCNTELGAWAWNDFCRSFSLSLGSLSFFLPWGRRVFFFFLLLRVKEEKLTNSANPDLFSFCLQPLLIFFPYLVRCTCASGSEWSSMAFSLWRIWSKDEVKGKRRMVARELNSLPLKTLPTL
jgi:hypothetical protein